MKDRDARCTVLVSLSRTSFSFLLLLDCVEERPPLDSLHLLLQLRNHSSMSERIGKFSALFVQQRQCMMKCEGSGGIDLSGCVVQPLVEECDCVSASAIVRKSVGTFEGGANIAGERRGTVERRRCCCREHGIDPDCDAEVTAGGSRESLQ